MEYTLVIHPFLCRGKALTNVNHEVDKISALNHQIAAAVEEQSAVTDEVNQNTQRISDIANTGIAHGQESKVLSASLLKELSSLHSLIQQFKCQLHRVVALFLVATTNILNLVYS